MYRPRAFASDDLDALDALVGADSFITLVTVRDGAPSATHLPVLYRRDGGQVELRGHWARANPQSLHAGPALAIVHGPHAYVSPTWYADTEAASRVPTWNYAAAHLHGTLQTFDDEPALAGLVDALSAQHEALAGGDWRFEPERPGHASQLRGIVGFRFDTSRIELKLKLSQNHPPANRAGVIARLQASPDASARDVARWMRTHEPSPPEGDA